jgi:hypothetical protein
MVAAIGRGRTPTSPFDAAQDMLTLLPRAAAQGKRAIAGSARGGLSCWPVAVDRYFSEQGPIVRPACFQTFPGAVQNHEPHSPLPSDLPRGAV